MRPVRLIAAALIGLGGAGADAVAQQPGVPPRIGYLEAYATPAGWFESFRRGLRELGYVEGRTIIIERRLAGGRRARLQDLAAELVGLRPRVIVASAVPGALAAKKSTASIPIVMTNTSDPVRLGLVASLARPGGNVTGLSTLSAGLAGKRLELVAEIVPGLARLGVIGHHTSRGGRMAYRELQSGAAALRLPLDLFEVRRAEDFDAAFKAAANRVGGVAVMNNPVIRTHREAVVAAAARHKVPALYFDSEIVLAGGLNLLRGGHPRLAPPRRDVRRQDPQGCETGRPAGRAADQVHAGGKPSDGRGAWHQIAALDPAPRGQGHRIEPGHLREHPIFATSHLKPGRHTPA